MNLRPLLVAAPRESAADQKMRRSYETPLPGNQQGFVLVAVLIVIMLASMVAISLMFRLRAEETAAAAGAGSEQAWAAALSGLNEAMRVAARVAPGELEWQDDPATFRDRLVCDDGADRWFFTVYAAGDADQSGLRYGLTDEAGKLNLNAATEAMVGKLPNLTSNQVECLLDFLDPDNSPRTEGAEQEYYDTLPNPYTVRNGPLASLEELLLVRGFTPPTLYGEDANLNFMLDPNEDDGDEKYPPDNKDGLLELGLRPWLTVWSYDVNQDNDSLPRLDLNSSLDTITGPGSGMGPGAEFPPALVQYIEALRSNKVTMAHPAELLEAKTKIKDAKGKETELESGVGKTELPALLDRFTGKMEYYFPGLINVNTASKEVLACVVEDSLAESIVATRKGLRPEQRSTIAWLYQEDLVDAAKFKELAPLLTARSFQYHVQVVGYGVPSGRYRVLEAVINTAGLKPSIVYLRDLTRLGLPFRVEMAPETGGGAARRSVERGSVRSVRAGERESVGASQSSTRSTLHAPDAPRFHQRRFALLGLTKHDREAGTF